MVDGRNERVEKHDCVCQTRMESNQVQTTKHRMGRKSVPSCLSDGMRRDGTLFSLLVSLDRVKRLRTTTGHNSSTLVMSTTNTLTPLNATISCPAECVVLTQRGLLVPGDASQCSASSLSPSGDRCSYNAFYSTPTTVGGISSMGQCFGSSWGATWGTGFTPQADDFLSAGSSNASK